MNAEQAQQIAKKLAQPGILAVMVDLPDQEWSHTINEPQDGYRDLQDKAREMASAAAEAAEKIAGTMPSGNAQIDMRTPGGGLKALSEARPGIVVTLVIPVGHPISKSLQRMVRRALAKYAPTPEPAPAAYQPHPVTGV